jgi:lipopolysaccharide export system protein LptA
MFQKTKYVFLFLFLLTGFISFGQVSPPPQPSKDTIREFEIIRGPSMRAIKIDSATTLQTIAGGAVIKQGSTIFHSDSAVVNPTTHILEAFGNIEINQADTVHTYSQYLKYLGIEKIAYLKDKVKLTNKSGTLTTNDLDYNLQTGIGNFHNGGKVVEGKSVITSLEGTYYDDTKDIYFKKNVKLDEPKKHIRADSLLYNMQTRKSSFISNTNIKTPEVEINTTQGTYDLNTGNAFFTNRSTVKDSSGRLYSANTMALENKTGNAQLEGNAVIIDSAAGYTIIANQVFLNKKNNSFLATRKPVLILKQKHDNTYIAADTIFSGFSTFVNNSNQVLKNDSTINVNIPENEKVHETITNDSTEKYFQKIQQAELDSIKKVSLENDSLKDSLNVNHLIKSKNKILSPPSKDTSQEEKIIRKETIDTTKRILPAADSLQKNEDIKLNEQINDSSKLDSSEKINPKKDTANFKIKQLKDSSNKTDTSIRYFLAFHHVRIFNDSLQSICDSLFISSKDSVFRLYYNPVMWSGNTQIAGDTMFLYTENKQPKRLYVFESGLIVNQTKEGFFNQMSGKTINGYFVDGKIDYMRVKGTQAESIYYMQNDDSAYIGMNRASADVIDMFFKNEDLKKVVFVNNINGKMFPMNQIPEDQKKLKNFKWLDAKRPKNKAELFE